VLCVCVCVRACVRACVRRACVRGMCFGVTDWPTMFLKRLACQCATKWPSLRSDAATGPQQQAGGQRRVDSSDADEEGAGEGTGSVGASFMQSLLDGEAEGLSEQGQGGRH
jgi:hypothetical protein